MAAAFLALGLCFLAWRLSRPPASGPAAPGDAGVAPRHPQWSGAALREAAGGTGPTAANEDAPLAPSAAGTPRDARSAPPEGGPAAPGALEIADRRALRVRVAAWMQPGLCSPQHGARAVARDALLATFVPVPDAPATLRHDRSVSPAALEAIVSALDAAVRRTRERTGLPSPPLPRIYVYADVEQLQRVSCVNRAAIGYYDGAIHLSGDPRHGPRVVLETVVHEYVHHVLSALGISTPMWLQEGLAMDVAGETWFLDPSLGLTAWLQGGHLPFEAMGSAFPHASDETFALAAYTQSYAMVRFVSARRGEVRLRELVVGLLQGQPGSADSFSWAAGLSGEPLEQAWRDAVARGDLLAPRR